jgi:uncharacterized protein (DUF58 family)
MSRLARIAAFGVVLAAFAGLFDAEALWVPAIGFVVLAGLLASGLALAARGARIERVLGAARAVEGQPLPVRLRARAGTLPLASGDLAAGHDAAPLGRLAPGRRAVEQRSDIVFARRGRHRLAPPELRLADPLGLGHRTVHGTGEDSILVLPRVEPVRALAGGGLIAAGEGGRAGVFGAESELDGLRPYREGAPATRIHWPALARGAGLVERRLLPDADRLPLVVLDPSRPNGEDALDAAVRAVGSLALALARTGGCAVLMPGDRRAAALDEGLAAWPALHARLALVEAGPAPALGAHVRRHRTLLYVAARRPERLPPALTAGPRSGRVLVMPAGPAPGPALFEVAGCRGYAVGTGAVAEAA